MKKCIDCKEIPSSPRELTYNDLRCNPCYIKQIDGDAFLRGMEIAKRDYQKAYQNLKDDLAQKISNMKLTERSKAFEGMNIVVETYNEKQSYNQALLDILFVLKEKNKKD